MASWFIVLPSGKMRRRSGGVAALTFELCHQNCLCFGDCLLYFVLKKIDGSSSGYHSTVERFLNSSHSSSHPAAFEWYIANLIMIVSLFSFIGVLEEAFLP